MAKGMLDPLNRRRFDNGQDYEYNPNQNPNNGLIDHKYPDIPQSGMLMLNLQNQEAEALTGVKSFSGGMSGESYGQVAAGIRGVLDAASKREMAILRRLAKGITEIGNKFIAMNAVFLSEEEVIRVTNTEFITVKREDLKGNFDLEVDISTAEVDDAKAKDLGFMLQTIGPNIDPQITMKILSEIAELKRMPELAHDLKSWKPTPDPIQEQLKQLEVQKAQKEIESAEGRLKYLKDRISMSTLHLTFYETTSAPVGFFGEIGKSFAEGWKGFLFFVLGIIRVWPILLIIATILFFIIKRRKK